MKSKIIGPISVRPSSNYGISLESGDPRWTGIGILNAPVNHIINYRNHYGIYSIINELGRCPHIAITASGRNRRKVSVAKTVRPPGYKVVRFGSALGRFVQDSTA